MVALVSSSFHGMFSGGATMSIQINLPIMLLCREKCVN